ncbi:unnamed protein product [Acanthosepion pharaonis]|uniref:Uncharacterized protein n=1 Tax=Acanthosepion pharaonis TaxID=158019 RepID=A0A812CG20_ACAPH|nr:unnamed protein product [Sepia pharaonis]
MRKGRHVIVWKVSPRPSKCQATVSVDFLLSLSLSLICLFETYVLSIYLVASSHVFVARESILQVVQPLTSHDPFKWLCILPLTISSSGSASYLSRLVQVVQPLTSHDLFKWFSLLPLTTSSSGLASYLSRLVQVVQPLTSHDLFKWFSLLPLTTS